MRIAVTGARGFIGSSLVPVLEARGHSVLAASREASSSAASFSGCETLVHLANIAHARADAALLESANVDVTRRIAERAAAAGVRRMIYLSSIKAAGEETRGRPFDGSEAPAPRDAYGRAKLAAERALAEVSAKTAMETVVLRPPLVYGPRVKAKFLALVRAIARGWPLPLAALHNRRSLLYVGNLADAIACCVEAPKLAGRPFVICDRPAVSTPELCQAFGRALGKPARLFPFPAALLGALPGMRALISSLEVDDSALRKALGWQPPVSFEEAIRLTAEWYRLECAP